MNQSADEPLLDPSAAPSFSGTNGAAKIVRCQIGGGGDAATDQKESRTAEERTENGSAHAASKVPRGDAEATYFLDRDRESFDSVDALPVDKRYSCLDLLCTLVSMATYILDLSMDVVVAVYFYHLAVSHGIYHYWYFGLTVAFILLPSLTMTGFSFRWYLMDADNQSLPEVPLWRWSLRLVVLMLQVAPILRYLDSIRYGVLSRWAEHKAKTAATEEERRREETRRVKYYTLMVYEDADATLLRLFECFMESAPQLVLQIYILIRDPHAVKLTQADIVGDEEVDPILKITILVVSILSSLVSLAWSLVVYQRSLRYTYHDKKNIGAVGSLCQFVWHFTSITARVLALSLFASAYPKAVFVVIAGHWAAMTAWVVSQRTRACNTRCEELLFNAVLGAIYVFSFFNAKEERTRYKYLIYYGFSLAENTALVALWFASSDRDKSWYYYPGIVAHYVMFFVGLSFMALYYGCFHPTGRRTLKLSGVLRRMGRKKGNKKSEDEAPQQEEEGAPAFIDLREMNSRAQEREEEEEDCVSLEVKVEEAKDLKLSKASLSKSSPQIEDAPDGSAGAEATTPGAVAASGITNHRSVRKTSSVPANVVLSQQQQRQQYRTLRGRTLKAMVCGGGGQAS